MDENEKRNVWMKMKREGGIGMNVQELYFAYNGGWVGGEGGVNVS